jgi:hypothetical protein
MATRKEPAVTTRALIGLNIVLAVLALVLGAAAFAASGPPPVQGARFDGRSPDTKDAALAAHRSNRSLSGASVGQTKPPDGTTFDGRSPDTKDAAYAAHHELFQRTFARVLNRSLQGSSLRIAPAGPPLSGVGYDGRSPDTKDAAASAHAG